MRARFARHAVVVVVLAAMSSMSSVRARAQEAGDEAPATASEAAAPAVDDSVRVAPPAGVAASPFAGDGGDGADGAVVNLTGIDIVDRVYFREDTFLGFMRSRVGEPLSRDALLQDAVDVTAQYQARGYLNAKVTVEVVDTRQGPRARFVVVAGERAELKEVHVVGHDLVDEEALKEGFFSRPPEPLGLLTRAGLYHKPYLDQDQQRLVFNYYKRGFLEARVVDTRVTASSDKSGLQVTLQVIEGAQYELASLTIGGELPDGDTGEALRARVAIKDGDVADLVLLQQQADPLLDRWRELGYPFARFEQQLAVGPPPSGDLDKKGIGITLNMVRGPKATVREIRIVGNKGTMDHVLRREIDVKADTVYDHVLVKRSEKNLMQTGILQSAAGRALPVPLQPGELPRSDGTALVDVEFTVAETTTWMLSPAAFGDANEGLILIGIAGDRNLLGTGLQAYTSVQWSALRFLFDASLTEPRLFGTRSSATIEAHRRELRYRDFIIGSVFGGSVRANYAYDLGWRLGGPARWFVGGGVGVEYGGVVSYDDKQLRASSLLPQDTFRNTVEVRGGFD
ncbi:MAG TPA: POTRA domain-containing protein, partial [Myxococcota bacterium]